MHADKYGRWLRSSMTLPIRFHSRDGAPGIAMYCKLLLALLLNLAVAHSAWALCAVTPATTNLTSTKAIDSSAAPIGAVVYEETWTRILTLTCAGTRGTLYTQTVRNGLVINVVVNSIQFESDVELSNAESSETGVSNTGAYTAYTFPGGVTRSTMTVRLRYIKTSNRAPGPGRARPRGTSTNIFGDDLIANLWNQIPSSQLQPPAASIFLQGGTKSYGSTCNLTVPPAVAIPAAPQRQFTGVGSVPPVSRNFNMSADCSGVVAGQVVGVSFSASSQDASGSPGVIATSQGAGKAAGVGLQIINTTSGRPVAFNALERGTPPPTLNGTYNFPMRVQYFQTAATVSTGTVTGTTVVTMQYR